MSQGSKENAERMAGVLATVQSLPITEYRICYQDFFKNWHPRQYPTLNKENAEKRLEELQKAYPDAPHRIESRQVTAWTAN